VPDAGSEIHCSQVSFLYFKVQSGFIANFIGAIINEVRKFENNVAHIT
jgi:hypothetical protein